MYVWKLPLGMVTFARTTLTALLSVTFTPISMICDTLRFVLFTGVRLISNGEVMSVSCVVTLPTSMVTLYNCGEKSPSSVMKLNLYWKYLLAFVGSNTCFAVLLVTSTNDSPMQDWSSQERVVTLRRTAPL